ncbi:MAG: Xaa-Pro peptidase family protein [Agriterribacter sp.]
MKRRSFLSLSAISVGATAVTGLQACASDTEQPVQKTTTKEAITVTTKGIVPISIDERKQRIAKAQQLMSEQKIAALLLDAGTSMDYFTGVQWWPSERAMIVIIPAKGSLVYICPAFEEDRLKELITIGDKIYTWQEDESPYKRTAGAFKDAGIIAGSVAIEERCRFFILDGISKEAPHLKYISGDSISAACRLIKSPAEIALMQRATDITVAAITKGIKALREGMTPGAFSSIVAAAHMDAGAENDFASVNFAKASALPHGSSKPQYLKKGDIVLMDCGCRVAGYSSDITRTIVFDAEPTKRQREIWMLEQKAQAAGFAAAMLNTPCEAVDIAARKVLTGAGFGPDYKLPGLPHRTGHGIGMDGHEWGNMVKGNKQLLQPGMCFSIEPTIAIPGEFGIRLEDCVYMTVQGPKWFSQPAVSIDQPFVV